MLDDRHPSLAIFFARANAWFDQALQASLRARGLPTTSHTQGLIIGYIVIGIKRPSTIARMIGISAQALTQPFADLRARGLINLVEDPEDARARVVELTEQGEVYLKQVRALLGKIEETLEIKFGRPVIDVVRMVVEEEWGEPPVSTDHVPMELAEITGTSTQTSARKKNSSKGGKKVVPH